MSTQTATFCQQCGGKLNPESAFCSGCSSSESNTPAKQTPPTSNKFLIGDSGQGHGTIIGYTVLSVVGGAIGVALMLWLANHLGVTTTTTNWGGILGSSTTTSRNELWTIFIFFAAAIGISTIVEACLIYSRGSKSEISAYENEVKGMAVSAGFLGMGSNISFRLTYDQITDVSIEGGAIVVNSYGTKYKCFVQEPDKLRDTIMAQQKKHR